MPVLTSRLLREPSVAGFPTPTGIPLCNVRTYCMHYTTASAPRADETRTLGADD